MNRSGSSTDSTALLTTTHIMTTIATITTTTRKKTPVQWSTTADPIPSFINHLQSTKILDTTTSLSVTDSQHKNFSPTTISDIRWRTKCVETKTRPGGQRCVLKPLFHFSFFLQLFHFFALIVALLSSSLLPAHSSCPSFLLVPPPSSSLFLTRPAPSESFRIRKRPFFIDFDESVTDQPTNGRTNQRTDGRTRPLIEMRGRI